MNYCKEAGFKMTTVVQAGVRVRVTRPDFLGSRRRRGGRLRAGARYRYERYTCTQEIHIQIGHRCTGLWTLEIKR